MDKDLQPECIDNEVHKQLRPYQFPEKLIPKTIIRASLGLKIPIYGTGKNVRDWLYVEDHVRAIELVLLKGESGRYTISQLEKRRQTWK